MSGGEIPLSWIYGRTEVKKKERRKGRESGKREGMKSEKRNSEKGKKKGGRERKKQERREIAPILISKSAPMAITLCLCRVSSSRWA